MTDLAKLRELLEKATKGPYSWTAEDYSMATLHGGDYLLSHILSVSPCEYECTGGWCRTMFGWPAAPSREDRSEPVAGQLSAEQVGDRLRLWKRLREQRDACADALRAIDPTNSALVGIPTRTQQLENILNACEDEKQLSPPPNEKQVSSFHESLHQSTMALRGTFADGTEEICPQDLVEAYAIPMDTNGHPQPPVHLMAVELLKYRALAQGQRESNSNPAPVHGQSKTGLTGSHPGAPTHQRSEALGTGATSPKERNASASSDHPSRTDRQEPGLSAEQIEEERKFGEATGDKMRIALAAMALRSLTARDEGIEAAAKALSAMPNRKEKLGGQTTQYIQRDEAIDTVRALKEASHD